MGPLKNKKSCIFIVTILIIILIITLIFFYNNQQNKLPNNDQENESIKKEELYPEYIIGNIVINDVDGNSTNYEFTYNNEIFRAVYTPDNWKIYNSYKIKNSNDIQKICQALIDIHPIHGKDMVSYRTATDMAYEWQQHNLTYEVLPSDNEWKDNAKDVDLDPTDQGKNLKEIYESRTGQPLDIDDIVN